MRQTMRYILILVLVLLSVGGMAQFRKPLSSPNNRKQSDEAMYNVGLFLGPNTTHWHHFNITDAQNWYLEDYTPKLKLGYSGGICFEAILSKHWSVGINAMYSRHRINMYYINKQFPYDWNNGTLLFKQRRYDLSADYHSIETSLPISFYMFSQKDPVRPYFYVAPSFSYQLGGNTIHTVTDSIPRQKPITMASDTASFVPINHVSFNVGATVGIGTQFRISLDYYYFLIRMGVSASWYFKNSFTKKQLENEFNNKRLDADAAATVTLIFPLKKRLFDACHIMN